MEKRGEIALEKQLVQWAEKRGCGLTQINAGKIIQLCGDDLLTLNSELESCAPMQWAGKLPWMTSICW